MRESRAQWTRLQSAVEYLSSYGWAILVIAIVLAVFFIFNPAFANQQCLLPAGFSCVNYGLSTTGLLTINFAQSTQSPINVTGISCSTNATATNITQISPATPVQIGTNTTLFAKCFDTNNKLVTLPAGSVFTGSITINYVSTLTGFPHSAFGKISVRVNGGASTTSTSSTSTTVTSTSTTSTTITITSTTSTTTSSTTRTSTSTTSVGPSGGGSPLSLASPVPTSQTAAQGQTAIIEDGGASGGSQPYSYQWLEEKPGTSSYSSAVDCAGSTTTSCSFVTSLSTQTGLYSFELVATDSASHTVTSSAATVVVTPASSFSVASPVPPSQSATQGRTATITDSGASGGTPSYTYQWMEEAPGASSYTNAVDCTTPTSTICSFVTTASTPVGTYAFELKATDSASNSATSTAATVTVTAQSSSLVIPSPSPPSQSATQGQTATIADAGASGGKPSYAYQWLEEAPSSGTYTNAADCAAPTTTTCAFATTSSTPTGTYSFALMVTDSASPQNTATSTAATVTVTPPQPLTVAAPTPNSQTILITQTATVLDTGAAGGTSPYTYQWLEKKPGASSYVNAVDCTAPTTTTCAFATISSTPTGTYSFELVATDSASRTVTSSAASVIVTPQPPPLTIASATPTSQTAQQGQTATITDSGASGGTPSYTYQWLEEAPGSGTYTNAVDCAAPTTITCAFVTSSSTPVGTYSFELKVTDSVSNTATSTAATVTVTPVSIFTVPSPTPNSQTIDAGQTATITDAGVSGGNTPYTYQWLEEKPGTSSYVNAVDCAAPTTLTCTFVTITSIQTGVYAFELKATDSLSNSATSTAATVTVNPPLSGGGPTT